MQEKIECEMTEVSSTKDMNDRDILNDVLFCLKNVSNNYSVAVNEMSNKKLYKEVCNILTETKDAAREAYDLAFSKGWYSLEESSEDKITQGFEKFDKLKKELA